MSTPIKPTSGIPPEVTHRWRVTLGRCIQDARMRMGVTQAELAEAAGIDTPQTVSSWERGDRFISMALVVPVADALGLSKKVFGKTVLRWTNPWVYAAIYGTDPELQRDLDDAGRVKKVRRGPRKPPSN